MLVFEINFLVESCKSLSRISVVLDPDKCLFYSFLRKRTHIVSGDFSSGLCIEIRLTLVGPYCSRYLPRFRVKRQTNLKKERSQSLPLLGTFQCCGSDPNFHIDADIDPVSDPDWHKKRSWPSCGAYPKFYTCWKIRIFD